MNRIGVVGLMFVTRLACAQNVDGLEIRGVVNEAGFNLGVAGVEVTIFAFTADRERTVLTTTATDGQGSFLVHPPRFGDYYVEVRKAGYVNAYSWNGPTIPQPATSGVLLSVNADQRSAEARFVLMRPGELSGRLIDENRQPLGGMLVEVRMAGWPSSSSLLGRATTTRTRPDGSFTTKAIIPGDYLVKISPTSGIRLITPPQLKEDDFTALDQDLDTFYWPSGSDERAATPVRVNPAAAADLGDIMVRRAPYYRVRISSNCRSGEKSQLLVLDAAGGSLRMETPAASAFNFSPAMEVTCGDVLVSHLQPGSYQFILAGQRGWGWAPVEITSRNIEVALAISEPVSLSGRLVAADGVVLPALDNVRVGLRAPFSSSPVVGFGPVSYQVRVDSKGVFTIANLSGLRHTVAVSGLNSPYYVSEIRADGVVSPDGTVSIGPGSKLEIVIDNKPATLTGRANGLARVFLVKWPSLEQVSSPLNTNPQGKFEIAGLPPGQYRAVALSAAPLPDGMQFNADILSHLWSTAEKIVLDRGGVGSVSLKIVDPMQ